MLGFSPKATMYDFGLQDDLQRIKFYCKVTAVSIDETYLQGLVYVSRNDNYCTRLSAYGTRMLIITESTQYNTTRVPATDL